MVRPSDRRVSLETKRCLTDGMCICNDNPSVLVTHLSPSVSFCVPTWRLCLFIFDRHWLEQTNESDGNACASICIGFRWRFPSQLPCRRCLWRRRQDLHCSHRACQAPHPDPGCQPQDHLRRGPPLHRHRRLLLPRRLRAGRRRLLAWQPDQHHPLLPHPGLQLRLQGLHQGPLPQGRQEHRVRQVLRHQHGLRRSCRCRFPLHRLPP